MWVEEVNLAELAENEDYEAQRELKLLLTKLEERKEKYSILDVDVVNGTNKFPPIPQQAQLFNDFKNRLNLPIDERLRYLLYYWGNGAWKTFIGAYICVLLALWHDGGKFNLPFIWSKKDIWIVTKSWSNVKSTIDRYLLWKKSPCKIPDMFIQKANYDNGILKSIFLKNGCKMWINTYDQGEDNLQGWEPDFIWLDEEPTKEAVWDELLARTRWRSAEMLITMTPLSGLTPIYRYFFEQKSEEVRSKMKIYKVSALDNPHTDKTLTKGFSEEKYRLRVEGSFENPTWLVYNEFYASKHVVPHFDPKLMGEVKYYRGIDFGTSHPTAVVFLAVDEDDNIYVFDEIRESDMLLSQLVKLIDNSSRWYNFEYFVRDSAAKREGLELKALWINTIPADKKSKGANDMSNRRTWILQINDAFAQGKLLISDRCRKLIRELETHYYKEGWKKDWEVEKENDDLIDALRYTIFMVKKNNKVNSLPLSIRKFNEKYSNKKSLSWFGSWY